MKRIQNMTAAECQHAINDCQKLMSNADADERDRLRNRIAQYAHRAAMLNRFIGKSAAPEFDSAIMPFMGG